MTWHVDPTTLAAYANDRTNDALAFSIEAHLLSCERCRSDLTGLVDGIRLEEIWKRTEATVSSSPPGAIERFLLRIGVADHVARLLAATPSLRLSWVMAIAVVLSVSVGAAYGSKGGYLLFLVLAPLLPVAGIAAAYGPGVDPTYEIGVASPLRGSRLLLIRAVAVLVTTLAMASVAALLMPDLDWRVAAWLLPSLALSAATLALSTVAPPLRAAAVVSAAWLIVVVGGAWWATGDGEVRAVFGTATQASFAAIAVVAGGVVALRRQEFERGEHA